MPFDRAVLLNAEGEAVIPSTSTEIKAHPDSRQQDTVLVYAKFENKSGAYQYVYTVGAYSNTGELVYMKPLPQMMCVGLNDTFEVTITLKLGLAV